MFSTDRLHSLRNRGLFSCILGFVIIVLASVLVPLYTPRVCTEYFCPSTFPSSAINDILLSLAQFQSRNIIIVTLIMILPIVLPLLASIMILVLSILAVLRKTPISLRWFLGGWIIGFIPFMILSFISLIYYFPSFGFFGIVIGYLLFFIGYLFFLTSQSSTHNIAP